MSNHVSWMPFLCKRSFLIIFIRVIRYANTIPQSHTYTWWRSHNHVVSKFLNIKYLHVFVAVLRQPTISLFAAHRLHLNIIINNLIILILIINIILIIIFNFARKFIVIYLFILVEFQSSLFVIHIINGV